MDGLPGDTSSTSIEYTSMPQLRRMFDINVFRLFEVTKGFLNLVRIGKGTIVMNTSVAGLLAGPFVGSYASSKFAIEGFSDSLRREVTAHRVRVSILECGFIATPILKSSGAKYIPESKPPYVEQERGLANVLWDVAQIAVSPRLASEAVIHAIRSKTPQPRYVVGSDSAILKVLRVLPSNIVDSMYAYAIENHPKVTEEDMKRVYEKSQTEFEL